MPIGNAEVHIKTSDDDKIDLTDPFYDVEAFDSIWQALKWKHIRTRVPICAKKTIRSRYFFANLVYLVYAIGILIIDFNPYVNGSADINATCVDTTTPASLDDPSGNVPLVNRFYIGNCR
jgi:hypothetical protein